MKQILNNDIKDLILDPHFFEWVVRPTKELDEYWGQFIALNPKRKKEFEDSIFIVKSLLLNEKELSDSAVLNVWNKIERVNKNRPKTRFLFSARIAAAIMFLLIGISGILYYQFSSDRNSQIDYHSIAKVEDQGNEVKLIFADKSEKILHSNDVNIKYNQKGEIQINSDKKITTELAESKSEKEQLNQLVVPRGRRTSLSLSDGTKLWLNSGSRAIYPVVFRNDKREIFIEGEAFLEVAHDQSKPFYVVTNNIRVKVLGTKFNVSAYPEDNVSSIVLVEGSVQTTIDSKKLIMKPNQLLTYEINSGTAKVQETEILPYISWKDGWMYCDKEKMSDIANKLSRYYNVKIDFLDQKAKNVTLTGKLDLKAECADIFKAISSTAPIKFELDNDIIILSSRSLN